MRPKHYLLKLHSNDETDEKQKMHRIGEKWRERERERERTNLFGLNRKAK
jgi:hypothetical protein